MKEGHKPLIVVVKEVGVLIFYADGWCVDSTSGESVKFMFSSVVLDTEKGIMTVEMADRQMLRKEGMGLEWAESDVSACDYLEYTVPYNQNDIRQILEWIENRNLSS